jgi:hypothetical protein
VFVIYVYCYYGAGVQALEMCSASILLWLLADCHYVIAAVEDNLLLLLVFFQNYFFQFYFFTIKLVDNLTL